LQYIATPYRKVSTCGFMDASGVDEFETPRHCAV
jgi:hypothetical protein